MQPKSMNISFPKTSMKLQRKEKQKVTCKDNIKNFLQNSTLHGLKYIGDSNLAKMERYMFGASFCLAVVLSAYYISEIYEKWSTTPVIITTSATPTLISEIPFPAITICNMNQAKRSRAERMKPGTLDYSLLQSLCSAEPDTDVEYTGKGGSWQYFRQFILNVSQPCTELLVYCRYGSETYNCDQLFDPILTDEGLCCAFNTIHPRFMYMNFNENDSFEDWNGFNAVDWSPETGYVGNLTPPYSPVPGVGTGRNMGLTVVLNASLDEYYCSSTNSLGFKVLLHNPIETPKISEYGFAIAPGMESRITITPQKHDSAKGLRRINVNHRLCLFSNEANNSYFRTYTSSNCQLECESRLMENECGCVLYHMPRTSQESVICGPKDMSCYQRVKNEINFILNRSSCDTCLSPCYSIYYEPSVTSALLEQNDVKWRRKLGKQGRNASIDVKNLAAIHFFYMRSSFRTSIREEFLGFVDFIANSGGILGLFLGFSILSVIELFYFFSVAPYYAMHNSKSKTKNDKIVKQVAGTQIRSDPFTLLTTHKYFQSRLLFPELSEDQILKVKPKTKNTQNVDIPYRE